MHGRSTSPSLYVTIVLKSGRYISARILEAWHKNVTVSVRHYCVKVRRRRIGGSTSPSLYVTIPSSYVLDIYGYTSLSRYIRLP